MFIFCCQCGDCDFIFAVKSHLLYHVVHCHMLNNVRSGKKTSCPWKNCKDKFKSTATKEVSKTLSVIKRPSCKEKYLMMMNNDVQYTRELRGGIIKVIFNSTFIFFFACRNLRSMSLYMSTRSNFESLHVNSNVIASRDISLSDSTVMGLYTIRLLTAKMCSVICDVQYFYKHLFLDFFFQCMYMYGYTCTCISRYILYTCILFRKFSLLRIFS